MKKLFIVANWKSNKTTQEAVEWLKQIKEHNLQPGDNELIICPAYTSLAVMNWFIKENNLPLKLGSQNISHFDEGAYTGEVNAKQVSEYATHVIVGHSERRRLLHETDEDILAKLKQVLAHNLTPVLCISDIAQLDHYLTESSMLKDSADKIIFVYEPPSAISGGGAYHPESPEDANTNAAEISKKFGKRVVTLYGGSVNPDNAKQLFEQEYIDGGLIGQASLDPNSFLHIIANS